MSEVKISLRYVFYRTGPGYDQEFSEYVEPVEGETVDELIRRVLGARVHRRELFHDRLEIQLMRPHKEQTNERDERAK